MSSPNRRPPPQKIMLIITTLRAGVAIVLGLLSGLMLIAEVLLLRRLRQQNKAGQQP